VDTLFAVLLVVFGYLLGSIPFALLYSLYIAGEDVREMGSGNIGATNVGRNFGWLAGILVLALDFAKGALPVYAVFYSLGSAELLIATLAGAGAVFGHVFPVYLLFRGGKGVATSAGVFAVLLPWATLAAIMFFLIALSSRHMAVASLTGATALPIVSIIVYGPDHPGVYAAFLLALVVFVRHRGNIKRLWEGREERLF